MLPLDPQRVRANVHSADTEDLLDRVTVYLPPAVGIKVLDEIATWRAVRIQPDRGGLQFIAAKQTLGWLRWDEMSIPIGRNTSIA